MSTVIKKIKKKYNNKSVELNDHLFFCISWWWEFSWCIRPSGTVALATTSFGQKDQSSKVWSSSKYHKQERERSQVFDAMVSWLLFDVANLFKRQSPRLIKGVDRPMHPTAIVELGRITRNAHLFWLHHTSLFVIELDTMGCRWEYVRHIIQHSLQCSWCPLTKKEEGEEFS